MREYIRSLESMILSGQAVSFQDALRLYGIDGKEDIEELCSAADRIREHFCGNEADLCTIMNARSGRCSEDCKFCAQSSRYKTGAEEYGMVSREAAIALAKENEEEGVNRFSLVTSGRSVFGDDLEKVLEIYEALGREAGMELCASHGILDFEAMSRLKAKGVTRYHHNLESSREYFGNICTTHSYDQMIQTINAARQAGLDVCSGGIIGMGESGLDRVSLAFELSGLGVESIPLNVLNPIKGTPLENAGPLSQDEILKTVALFRFINPKADIRLAGGRNLIHEYGKDCFRAGANATITGNYLTTSGNKIADDKRMLDGMGFQLREKVKKK
ncbi:MAG: biotin synthase [Firmicutes bacterium]|nr:biotin synthase [Bacillota bacterium]